MPSASNTIKLEKQGFGPQLTLAENSLSSTTTTATTAPSSITSNENNANNPMKLALVTIEHKIRNLEKRKTKLESYRAIQSSGKELSADQKAAVAKYDAVAQTLEFARDLSKQMMQFAKDAEKEQKKQARKDIIVKAQAETAKIREVLVIQNILSCMADDYIRMDFVNGENGALKLDAADLNVVEKFYLDIQARRPENINDVPFLTAAQKAAEYLSMTIDGRPKQYGGEVTFETVRRIFQQIQECGYLDKIYLAPVEETAEVEQSHDTMPTNEHPDGGNAVTDNASGDFVIEKNVKTSIKGDVDEDNSYEDQSEKPHLEEKQNFIAADGQQNLIQDQNHDNKLSSEKSDLQEQIVDSPSLALAATGVATQPPQPQRQRVSSATVYQSGTASPVQVAMFTQHIPSTIPTAQQSGVINPQQQQQSSSQQLQQTQQQIGGQQIVSSGTIPQTLQLQQQPQIPSIQQSGATLVTSAPVQAMHGVAGPHFSATTVRAVEQGYFKQHQYMQQIRPLAEVIGSGSFYFLQDSELDSPDMILQQQQQHHQEHQKQQDQLSHSQQQVAPPLQHQILQQQQLPPQQQQQQQSAKISTVVATPPIPSQTFTNQSFPPMPVQAAVATNLYSQQQTSGQQQPQQQQVETTSVASDQKNKQQQQQQQSQSQQQPQPPLIIMARVPQARISVNTGTPTVLPIQAAVTGFQFENQVVSSIPFDQQQQQQQQQVQLSGINSSITVTANHSSQQKQQLQQQQQELLPAAVSPNDKNGDLARIGNDWDATNPNNNSSSSAKGRNSGSSSAGGGGARDIEATASQTVETNQWSTEMNSISPPPQTNETSSKRNEWSNGGSGGGGGGTYDNRQQHQPGHESNHWNTSNQGGGDGNSMGGGGYGGRGRWRNYRSDRNRDVGGGGGGSGNGGGGSGGRNNNDRGDRGMRGGGGDRGRSNYSSQQNGGRNSGSGSGGNMYFRNNDNSYYQNGGNSNSSAGTGGYNSSKEGGTGGASGGGNRYENSGNYRSRGGGGGNNNSSRPANNNCSASGGGGGNVGLPPNSRTQNNTSNRSNLSGTGGGANTSRGSGRNTGGGSTSYVTSRQTSRQQQDVV